LEQPIAYMSKGLRGVELNYAIMDKQAYFLVQALKHFRVDEGKLLSHIMSKKGIKINLARIEVFQHVPLPSSKQAM
jgi:hypothetical protein